MSNFDLSSLDALTKNQEEGLPLAIKHPVTGDPIGLTLRIAGAESDAVKKVQRKQLNARLKEQRKKTTAEDIERNQRDLLVAMVLGWEFNGLTLDGQTPAYSKEAAIDLLRRFPWIGSQIDDFGSDQANFLPN